MPIIDPADLAPAEAYHLLTSLVVPRPIAWVASRAKDGAHNLAPHSYFNAISSDPLIVHVTSTGVKDTLTNIRSTGAFTISMVSAGLLEAMNTTAADFPPEEDEFEWAGLTKAPSDTIDVPYVAEAPAAMECTLRTILSMGTGHMIFGDVTRLHVADRIWNDGRVDMTTMAPVGRLSGSQYTLVDEVTRMPRPHWADIQARQPDGED